MSSNRWRVVDVKARQVRRARRRLGAGTSDDTLGAVGDSSTDAWNEPNDQSRGVGCGAGYLDGGSLRSNNADFD
jgi:hypothetical protein